MPRQRLLVVEANFFSLPPSFCSYLTIFNVFFFSLKIKKNTATILERARHHN